MTLSTDRGSLAPWLAGAVVLVAALALYLLTLDDGIRMGELQGGDLITHQYAQVEGRFSNAPGYPLYTLGGWLWFRLGRLLAPWATPIQVLSLYSTLWGLAALAVMYVLALQLSRGHWPLAAAATLFYSVTYFFWYYSVSTEQYTSAVFQTLLLVLLAFRWEQTGRDHLLGWMAFLAGTCAANLVTTLLILPPLAWFVLSRRPDLLRRRGLLVRLAALFALPLVSYAFVYIRGAQHPEWRGQGEWPSTLAWFLDFISTSQGREEMTLSLLPLDLRYLELVPGELTWPVLLAGLAGLALLARRRAVMLLATLVLYLLFTYVDRFGNWYQVIMPAYPLVILGVVVLAERLRTRLPGPWSPLVPPAVALLLVLGAGERLVTNFPRADLSRQADDDGLCPGQAVLADLNHLGKDGEVSVLVTYEEYLALQYLQTILDEGRGVEILTDPQDIGSAEYLSRHAAHLVLPAPGWEEPAAVGQVLLARALPAGSGLGWASLAATSLGPLRATLRALDYRDSSPACGGPGLLALIEWRADEPLDADVVLSVRALAGGEILRRGETAAQDDHPLLWGLVPAAGWSPGQGRLEAYYLPLPEGASPDALGLVAYTQDGQGIHTLWEGTLLLPPGS
ncbi:MAG: protein O-mannosyl-transferase family [Anaerolineae bacterium]